MSQWRIKIAEQDMNLGNIDNMVFGNDTCHSFMVLENPDGEVVSEIHGTTYHPARDRVAYGGQSAASYTSVIASSLGVSGLFKSVVQAMGVDDQFPRLKAVVTNKEWRAGDADYSRVVLEGDRNDIIREWIDACRISELVNELDLFYTPICAIRGGQNCNTVTSILCHAMDVDVRVNEFNMAAVGVNNEMHERVALLKEFDTRQTYTDQELANLLDYYCSQEQGIYGKEVKSTPFQAISETLGSRALAYGLK
jgi:hypothetical protein